MYPDYGSPGSPNMDPHYLSPREITQVEADHAERINDFRIDVAGFVIDSSRDMDPRDVFAVLEEVTASVRDECTLRPDALPTMVSGLLQLPPDDERASMAVAADRAIQAALIALTRAVCLLESSQGRALVQLAHSHVAAMRSQLRGMS